MEIKTVSVINGSLLSAISLYHNPTEASNAAVLIVDEIDKWSSETLENSIIRQNSQRTVLENAKKIGCRVIVLHEFREGDYASHIREVVDAPDLSCVKRRWGVLSSDTKPKLLPYLKENNITSLIVMGGSYKLCLKESLIGRASSGLLYSGLLQHHITVLTSPTLMSPYKPEIYPFEPKFETTAITFQNTDQDQRCQLKWPDFTLHQGVRIYTEI